MDGRPKDIENEQAVVFRKKISLIHEDDNHHQKKSFEGQDADDSIFLSSSSRLTNFFANFFSSPFLPYLPSVLGHW